GDVVLLKKMVLVVMVLVVPAAVVVGVAPVRSRFAAPAERARVARACSRTTTTTTGNTAAPRATDLRLQALDIHRVCAPLRLQLRLDVLVQQDQPLPPRLDVEELVLDGELGLQQARRRTLQLLVNVAPRVLHDGANQLHVQPPLRLGQLLVQLLQRAEK